MNHVKTAITAAVAFLILIMVVTPMISDATDEARKTYYRNTGAYYTLAEDSARTTIEIDGTESVTINGKTMTLDNYGPYIYTNTLTGAYYPPDDSTSIYTTKGRFISNSNNSISIIFENGEWTLTYTTNSTTITVSDTYEYLLHYNNGIGNYTTTSQIPNKFLNEGDRIFFSSYGGLNNTASTFNGSIIGSGVVGSGAATGTVLTAGTTSGSTVNPINITWGETDNGNGTVSIDKFTYADLGDSTSAIIPTSYYTSTDTPTSMIVGIVPLILFGGLILVLIGTFAFRRD